MNIASENMFEKVRISAIVTAAGMGCSPVADTEFPSPAEAAP